MHLGPVTVSKDIFKTFGMYNFQTRYLTKTTKAPQNIVPHPDEEKNMGTKISFSCEAKHSVGSC